MILLYSTILIACIIICSIDSIVENGYTIHTIVTIIILYCLCKKYLTIDDIDKFTY